MLKTSRTQGHHRDASWSVIMLDGQEMEEIDGDDTDLGNKSKDAFEVHDCEEQTSQREHQSAESVVRIV